MFFSLCIQSIFVPVTPDSTASYLLLFVFVFFAPAHVSQGHQGLLVKCGSGLADLNFRNTWLALYFFVYIYIGHTKETCVVRANCSPSCLEITLGLSTMDWHSPQGSLLPTARPWLCLAGASRRGKAESSWLAQTVWGLALQPQLPRRCWVGLGWQPPHCYFSEVISEINHRTLSRGRGGLCCMQGDHRSQCWGCELEAKTGAWQQGRAGHQWNCASVASQLLLEALLELQPSASPGWALAEHRGTVPALPLSAGLGQLHFQQITLKIWGSPGFFTRLHDFQRRHEGLSYYSLQHTMES